VHPCAHIEFSLRKEAWRHGIGILGTFRACEERTIVSSSAPSALVRTA
jgi:hypothetical protein